MDQSKSIMAITTNGHDCRIPCESEYPMSIFVASSCDNKVYPEVVRVLAALGHNAYSFRNINDNKPEFQWDAMRFRGHGTPEQIRAALKRPDAQTSYHSDMATLANAQACLMVLPCGLSSHLVAGYAAGLHKRTAVFTLGDLEKELMYNMFGRILLSWSDLVAWAKQLQIVEGVIHGSI